MKTKTFLSLLIVLSFLMLSCKSEISKYHEKKSEIRKIAHSYNCLTIEELCDFKHNNILEEKLPCVVYLDGFYVSDIVSYPDIPEFIVDDFDGEFDDPEKERKIYFDWAGKPSNRRNECWIKLKTYSKVQFQYIGLDKTQAEWIVSKTQNTRAVRTPIIIKLYQVGFSQRSYPGSSSICYTADLISILNERTSVINYWNE